jgi:thioredoxin-like negative regulator of GroEL
LDAAELYKRAEASLAVRDPAGAREFLERLVREYPTDSRTDAARYDLALIARSFGQRQRALELLDALIANGTDENLRAAARRLRPTLVSP